MSLLDEFFANEFLTLVDKRKSPARGRKQRASGKSAGALGPSQRLAELGFTVAPLFGKFLDFAAVHARSDVGALCMFSINDVVPAGGRVRPSNALAFMLEQPFRVDATMTHSLPLGTTGSGDIWLVSLAAKRGRHDVFLYGHDTGSVEHVADSVEALALALHLSDRDAAPTAAERRMLAGHVVNNDDIDLAWLGKKRLAKTSSPVQRLHERTYDLRSTLNGYGRHLPAPAGKLPARPVPAEALDAMLRAFLRVEDQALDALFVRFREAPSGLVRDSVSLLRKLLGQRAPATFEGRARLLLTPAENAAARRQARDRPASKQQARVTPREAAIAKADRAARDAEAAQAGGDHQKAVAEFQKALQLAPKHAGRWAALCYSLSCLERWPEMLAAAKRTTALDRKSSYAYQQLAVAYAGLKDDAGTIRASRRALELDPKNAYAMYNLATTLLVNGKTEGRKLLERACKLAPVLRDDAERDPDIVGALAALER